MEDRPSSRETPVYVYSPYLRFLGGGEKYLASMLAILQGDRQVCLVCRRVDAASIAGMSQRFGVDLGRVQVHVLKSDSEEELVRLVPRDASFLQVANGIPLQVPCRQRLLHAQIKYPRLDEQQAQKLFQGRSAGEVNREIARRYAQQDRIVFASSHVRDFMVEEWNLERAKTQVLYPSVSDEFFSAAECSASASVLSVGRFEPIKQQQVQLMMVQRLKSHAPAGFGLTLLGATRTPLAVCLEEQARLLPVRFAYGLDLQSMPQAYRSALVCWSTTGYQVARDAREHAVESFGLAIAEAMACGCVPVAIDAGGVGEIIESGRNGFLVRGLEEMEAATLQLLRDREVQRELSDGARVRARRFSSAEFRRGFRELLDLS